MKLASGFLNVLLCIILFAVILMTQFLIFTVISSEAHTDTIHIISAKEDEVSYVDGIGFMITDITTNLQSPPKYRVRSWFANPTWEKCTLWADFAIDKIWGSIRPVFVPTFDIYLMQVSHMEDYETFRTESGKNLLDDYQNGAWIYILESEQFLSYFGEKTETRNFQNTVKSAKLSLPYYYYNEEIDGHSVERILTIDQYRNYCLGIEDKTLTDKEIFKYEPQMTKLEWIAEYNTLYNFIERFVKYNNEPYSLYYDKFIDERNEIKTATISVYCQLIVAFVLAVYFTYQNKIVLKENEYRESEVHGGIHLPGFGSKKKKRQHPHKKDEERK